MATSAAALRWAMRKFNPYHDKAGRFASAAERTAFVQDAIRTGKIEFVRAIGRGITSPYEGVIHTDRGDVRVLVKHDGEEGLTGEASTVALAQHAPELFGKVQFGVRRDAPNHKKGGMPVEEGFVKEYVEADGMIVHHPAGNGEAALKRFPLTQMKNLALLDVLTANEDRHTGNILYKGKTIIPIDHGFTMKKDLSSYSEAEIFVLSQGTTKITPTQRSVLTRLQSQAPSLNKAFREAGLQEDRILAFWQRHQSVLMTGDMNINIGHFHTHRGAAQKLVTPTTKALMWAVHKYNPYHDKAGRFTSGPRSPGGGLLPPNRGSILPAQKTPVDSRERAPEGMGRKVDFDADLSPGDPRIGDPDYAADALRIERTQQRLDKESMDFPNGQSTEALHDLLNGAEGVYTPEREKLHQEIVDELMAEAASVPSEGKAVVLGGVPGAGKTTVITQNGESIGIEADKYLRVDPDRIKDIIVEKAGLPPQYKTAGLKGVNEAATLLHGESSKIAKQLATQAARQRKNLIWDISMSSAGSVEKRITELKSFNYNDIALVFVDVNLQTSLSRAGFRHRNGGRYVPYSLIESAFSPWTGTSANYEAFKSLVVRKTANRAYLFDNNADMNPKQLPLPG